MTSTLTTWSVSTLYRIGDRSDLVSQLGCGKPLGKQHFLAKFRNQLKLGAQIDYG